MNVWLFLVLSNMLIGWCGAATPSAGFMRRAYCACVCCEKESDKCYRHSSIDEDFQCVQDDCTEDFCVRWHKAKCESSCYCEKCKAHVPPEDFHCKLHDGIPANCKCGDMNKIECEIDEDYEAIKEAKEQYAKMKAQSHCLAPCYCKKCKDIPDKMIAKCKEAGPPPDDCSCKDTVCPTKEDVARYQKLMKSDAKGFELMKQAITDSWSSGADDAEVDAINEKLKSAIDAGIVPPMTKSNLLATKCQLQCICDSCKWNSPDMELNCNKIIGKKIAACPKCPENIQCPEVNPEANCKMYCFCLRCKEDKRMPITVGEKCDQVMEMTTEICPCEEKVDCNVLGQVDQLLKKQATSTHTYVTSEDGKPRPGKIKPKHKMWDEL